jgi:hypothetical protein
VKLVDSVRVIDRSGAGAAFTVKVAVLLVTLPALFVTTTVNFATSSALVVGGVVYVEDVAPLTGVPFLFHWYDRGVVPVAVTLNVAVAGAVTVWLCGWALIEGATTGGGGEELPPHPQPKAAKTIRKIKSVENVGTTRPFGTPGVGMSSCFQLNLGQLRSEPRDYATLHKPKRGKKL